MPRAAQSSFESKCSHMPCLCGQYPHLLLYFLVQLSLAPSMNASSRPTFPNDVARRGGRCPCSCNSSISSGIRKRRIHDVSIGRGNSKLKVKTGAFSPTNERENERGTFPGSLGSVASGVGFLRRSSGATRFLMAGGGISLPAEG